MRLISWNANFNSHRRSLEDTVRILEPLGADILILSETAPPSLENIYNAQWTGGTPGLAVISRPGIQLSPHAADAGPPGLMAGYSVKANFEFFLLAVWPVKTSQYSYSDVLMTALERFGDPIQSGPVIMAGDFNSSTRVLNQKRSHPEFVRAAESLGLASAYQSITGEAHGQESVATYRHGKGSAKEFHLDYFFASTPLLPLARLEVLQGAYWEGLSDHFPIVLDLQD